MSDYHARAEAEFAAIPTPADASGVAFAQAAAKALWEQRGSYGCERHLFVATMQRVSRPLYPAPRRSAREINELHRRLS